MLDLPLYFTRRDFKMSECRRFQRLSCVIIILAYFRLTLYVCVLTYATITYSPFYVRQSCITTPCTSFSNNTPWRYCPISRKVASSIPDDVIRILHWRPSGLNMTMGVDPPCNRTENREYFLGGKGGWCVGLTTLSR